MTKCPHCGKAIAERTWRDYLTENRDTRKLSFYSNQSKTAGIEVRQTCVYVPKDIKRADLDAIMILIEIEHKPDPFFRWGMARGNLMNYILRDGLSSVDV